MQYIFSKNLNTKSLFSAYLQFNELLILNLDFKK